MTRLPRGKTADPAIGSLATDGRSTIGPWSADGHPEETVTGPADDLLKEALNSLGSGSSYWWYHRERTAMGQLVLDNLASWFAGKGPLTPVVETPWKGAA